MVVLRLAHFMIYRFVIRNIGLHSRTLGRLLLRVRERSQEPLLDLAAQLVGSTVGSWYNKKWIAYDDSLRLRRGTTARGRRCPRRAARPGAVLGGEDAARRLARQHRDEADDDGGRGLQPTSNLRDEDRERYPI